MKHAAWIVCESSGRWAAALRLELAHREQLSTTNTSVLELRSISELNEQLGSWPLSIGLLEVSQKNFAQVLDWLAKAWVVFPRARFAALIDSQSFLQQKHDDAHAGDRQLVMEALSEAGAEEAVTSLRQIRQILDFGSRHFERLAQFADQGAQSMPIADWAWASLPWQDRQRPLVWDV
jgi:hypothetical protein